MNKLFLYLVVIGILILVTVVTWEGYQISTGARSKFSLVVIDLNSDILINEKLETHLRKDSKFDVNDDTDANSSNVTDI